MEKDILIERVNATTLKLYTEDQGIIEDLYQEYIYSEPTFSKNKYTKWDGVVRMFNKSKHTLPYGLLHNFLKLAKTRQWKLGLDDNFKDDIYKISSEKLQEWVDNLDIHDEKGNSIIPYDYQVEGLHHAIIMGRCIELLATSAGKSLLIAMLARFYYEFLFKTEEDKILIVVPSVMLVNQLNNDFANYFSTTWETSKLVHTIYEGQRKHTAKPIVITTYQSMIEITKNDPEYFEQFTHVIQDEVHMASGKVIGTILDLCVNAYRRVGLTGTLKTDKISPIQIESHFGPVKRIVTTKELQNSGRAAKTEVTMFMLEYPKEQRRKVINMPYQEEIDFLINQPFRNKVIKSCAKALKGNTLILFDRVEAHLKKIVEELNTEENTNKVYLAIHGSVKQSDRNIIKKATEENTDIVLFATFGTMSTGVSIKRLHNLVVAHPTKSIIRVLQSLGRIIRLHESKDIARIYTIVDDCRLYEKENASYRHGAEQYKFYQQDEHPVTIKKYSVPEITK